MMIRWCEVMVLLFVSNLCPIFELCGRGMGLFFLPTPVVCDRFAFGVVSPRSFVSILLSMEARKC